MATLDEELLHDAEEDAREAAYILNSLPADLQSRFTTDEVLALMDYIVEYYYTSGILESNDEYVDIDLDKVAEYVCRKAEEEGVGSYAPDDVFFIVQADMDYQEQNLD